MQTAREGFSGPVRIQHPTRAFSHIPQCFPFLLKGAFVKTTNITVFEKTIRIDAEGRFCLNDIHKAAMANGSATESQRPGSFFQSESVQSFVEAVDENATIVAVKKTQGRNGGTYATELVAVMFAEELALVRIERDNAQGNPECIQHSRKAATETKRVIENAV